MARGYLKHNRSVGRKTARGNSSRSQVRWWMRAEKQSISRKEKAFVQGCIVEYGHEDIRSDYYDHLEQEIDHMFSYHDEQVSLFEDTPCYLPIDAVPATDVDLRQETGHWKLVHQSAESAKTPSDSVAGSDEESMEGEDELDTFEIGNCLGRPDFSVHQEDTAGVDHSSESSYSLVSEDQSSHSYSLCDDTEGSTSSFSIVSNDHRDISSSGSATMWEFVANSIDRLEQSAQDPSSRLGCVAFTNTESNETDSISCVSECTETAQTLTEIAQNPRLFALTRCAICLEEKVDVLRLMHKCNHPSACRGCLRTHYVEFGLKDTANFPLQCFWPGCKRILRDVQIRPLTRNRHEMSLFYQQQRAAHQEKQAQERKRTEKAMNKRLQQRRVLNFKLLQSCAACSTPHPVRPARQSHYQCTHCSVERPIDVISLEEVQSIVAALGDYLVNCPACEALIIKNGGCDHMTCICEKEFSFQRAQNKLTSYENITWQTPRRLRELGSEQTG